MGKYGLADYKQIVKDILFSFSLKVFSGVVFLNPFPDGDMASMDKSV
jgi:hypothetical protein